MNKSYHSHTHTHTKAIVTFNTAHMFHTENISQESSHQMLFKNGGWSKRVFSSSAPPPPCCPPLLTLFSWQINPLSRRSCSQSLRVSWDATSQTNKGNVLKSTEMYFMISLNACLCWYFSHFILFYVVIKVIKNGSLCCGLYSFLYYWINNATTLLAKTEILW